MPGSFPPPAAGKSLIARKLGQLLGGGRDPKVVNGPEVQLSRTIPHHPAPSRTILYHPAPPVSSVPSRTIPHHPAPSRTIPHNSTQSRTIPLHPRSAPPCLLSMRSTPRNPAPLRATPPHSALSRPTPRYPAPPFKASIRCEENIRCYENVRSPVPRDFPQILQRWVGQSEENIRLLFADAEVGLVLRV